MISQNLIILLLAIICCNSTLCLTPKSSPIMQFDISLDEPIMKRYSEVAKKLCPSFLNYITNVEKQIKNEIPGGQITLTLLEFFIDK